MLVENALIICDDKIISDVEEFVKKSRVKREKVKGIAVYTENEDFDFESEKLNVVVVNSIEELSGHLAEFIEDDLSG